MHATRHAIDKKRRRVSEADVNAGIRVGISEVDHTIVQTYVDAVVSQRHDDTLYEPVLLACALAECYEAWPISKRRR